MSEFDKLATCHAAFDGATLTVGNALFSRRWKVEHGLLRAVSVKDEQTGREWLESSGQPAPLAPGGAPEGEPSFLLFNFMECPTQAAFSPSLEAILEVGWSSERWFYTFRIFPGSSGVLVTLEKIAVDGIKHVETIDATHTVATGVELSDRSSQNSGPLDDIYESLRFTATHLKLRAVEFEDQTDVHSQLVFEREYLPQANEDQVRLRGNLFIFEDSLTGEGLIFLKHAPLPKERPQDGVAGNAHDLEWGKGAANFRAVGFVGSGTSYGLAMLAYQGGKAGASAALHRWQREFRNYDPHVSGLLLSNTWGDRSQDARINAAFIEQEIEAAATMGVDIVQIDDGWECGVTSNSVQGGGVWEGFWASNDKFWEVHPEKFPNGLEPLVEKSRSLGMRLGLWFGPDSANDFANWERDADVILGYHRQFGIDHFKFDGIKVHTKLGEANLHRQLDKIRRESNGKVLIDLDITAEIRPGYWGAIDCGPLFLENRYTDWHNYWPHQTLRSAWQLSHCVDPLRLRMEFLNNTRNTANYPDDPIAPGKYSPEYLFATTMFFNPLGWFEVSNLPEDYRTRVAALVAIWKQHREAIYGGTILPIGNAPDGTSWTGFVSLDEARESFYFVVFRELSQSDNGILPLPLFSHSTGPVEVLAGSGEVKCLDGNLHVKTSAPLSFVFGRGAISIQSKNCESAKEFANKASVPWTPKTSQWPIV